MKKIPKDPTKQKLLRPIDVCQKLSIGRTTLHNLENGDPDFPRKIRLSPRCVGWIDEQIDAYLITKADKTHGSKP